MEALALIIYTRLQNDFVRTPEVLSFRCIVSLPFSFAMDVYGSRVRVSLCTPKKCLIFEHLLSHISNILQLEPYKKNSQQRAHIDQKKKVPRFEASLTTRKTGNASPGLLRGSIWGDLAVKKST